MQASEARTRHASIQDATRSRAQDILVLVLGCGGLVSAADNWMVSPILPSIASGLGVSVAQAGMVLAAYMIPYGLMQPVHGHSSGLSSGLVGLGLFGGGGVASAVDGYILSHYGYDALWRVSAVGAVLLVVAIQLGRKAFTGAAIAR